MKKNTMESVISIKLPTRKTVTGRIIPIDEFGMTKESPSFCEYVRQVMEVITGKEHSIVDRKNSDIISHGNIDLDNGDLWIKAFASSETMSKMNEKNSSVKHLREICLLDGGVYFPSVSKLECADDELKENLQLALEIYQKTVIMEKCRKATKHGTGKAIVFFKIMFREINKIRNEKLKECVEKQSCVSEIDGAQQPLTRTRKDPNEMPRGTNGTITEMP